MKRGIAITIVCVMLSLLSCTKEKISGTGPMVTQTRTVSNFTAVSTTGSTNVYITQGPVFKVEVKGSGNLLPYYETKVISNTLLLGYKQNVNIKNDNTEVYITMPILNAINIFGSGSAISTGPFTGNTNFNASISGSGNISIEAGTAQNFFATIAGSGHIHALDFVAEIAEITTSGSGNVEITANNQLKVKITGSGNVYYRGTPAITSTISGSGVVIPR